MTNFNIFHADRLLFCCGDQGNLRWDISEDHLRMARATRFFFTTHGDFHSSGSLLQCVLLDGLLLFNTIPGTKVREKFPLRVRITLALSSLNQLYFLIIFLSEKFLYALHKGWRKTKTIIRYVLLRPCYFYIPVRGTFIQELGERTCIFWIWNGFTCIPTHDY